METSYASCTISVPPLGDAEMAVQVEGPAVQCSASPARGDSPASTPQCTQGCWSRTGWAGTFTFPVNLWCFLSAARPSVPSSLLLVPDWGWEGCWDREGCLPPGPALGMGAAEGQQAPGSPCSPRAAGQRGVRQVRADAGLSLLAGPGNTWWWLMLPWDWGAASWAGGQMRFFWDRGMDRGSR